MKTPLRLLVLLALTFAPVLPAIGKVPILFKRALFDPSTARQAGADLGRSVATEGRYAVIGAPSDDIAGENSGVVKVFDSTTGALLFVLPRPGPGGTGFGRAVAISGTRVAVGAPGVGSQDDDEVSGAVYVFDLASRTPKVPIATFYNPSSDDDSYFGYSVGISGSRVIVGSSEPETNLGHSYLYDLISATPAVPTLTIESLASGSTDYTNTSVAISGSRVVVGVTVDILRRGSGIFWKGVCV